MRFSISSHGEFSLSLKGMSAWVSSSIAMSFPSHFLFPPYRPFLSYFRPSKNLQCFSCPLTATEMSGTQAKAACSQHHQLDPQEPDQAKIAACMKITHIAAVSTQQPTDPGKDDLVWG